MSCRGLIGMPLGAHRKRNTGRPRQEQHPALVADERRSARGPAADPSSAETRDAKPSESAQTRTSGSSSRLLPDPGVLLLLGVRSRLVPAPTGAAFDWQPLARDARTSALAGESSTTSELRALLEQNRRPFHALCNGRVRRWPMAPARGRARGRAPLLERLPATA